MKKFLFLSTCVLNLFAFENKENVIKMLEDQIDLAVDCAEKNLTQLPKEIFSLHGMSSRKNRILLNTLGAISKKIPVNYLEIGVWKGSTFIASNYGNSFKKSVAIDNWSEFKGPKDQFLSNTSKYLGNSFTFLNADCYATSTLKSLEGAKFDIYFYDGHHSEENQYKAFKVYDHLLSDVFVAIVDDWAWPQVKAGTFRAFDELGYQMIKKFEIDTVETDPYGYWNGLIVALMRKTR